MKSFKKLFTAIAISASLVIGTTSVQALTILDVASNYWASDAIVDSVQHNYILLKNEKFYPETPITRSEFANAVYNVIQRMPFAEGEGFNDVTYQSKYGKSILTLQQLQIVCGYPSGNFKPDANLKRSEASSIIANVVRSDFWDKSVLNSFKDKNDVPIWATPSYINNIINQINIIKTKSF